jgi:UDPglucose--hexose-1-phosphate uridylyltransferase
MAKFVPDIKTQRWIVISPVRSVRPDEHKKEKKPKKCPFCEGNESETPPEVYRVGEGVGEEKGWQVRVVPNKYPITDTHEVIIHSPFHQKDIEDLSTDHVALLLTVYKSRFQHHAGSGQVMIFCNHGEPAGASLTHPHSQLVVLPKQINLDALVREPVMNVVEESKDFVSYCPDFSQWPYEVWIAPKKEDTVYADIEGGEVKYLASILQKSLKRLSVKHSQYKGTEYISGVAPFAYNFYIHHSRNWFIRIIPRLIHRAGFELGTGLSVNIVDPTIAAEELKQISI